DKQGRIQIPQPLRDYGAIAKDVVVVGVADWVEIWDAETWSQLSNEADELYAGIEEALSGEGI
ncbi:MAG: hypothetical protein ACE5EV_03190, partial [Gaiellales bacterium]